MKTKELKTIKEKDLESLKKEEGKIRADISKSKIDLRTSKEKNLKKVKNLTRDLSQVLTIIREKEITAMESKKKQKGGKRVSLTV